MNLPGVIIVGAQKCGTTTLHASLTSHSKISGPVDPVSRTPVKEIDFFSDENWRKGLSWYAAHYPGAKDLCLDSSPNYLIFPTCHERMAQVVPEAKLIVCLRNPVSRALSQYNHYRQDMPITGPWDWYAQANFLTNIKLELQARLDPRANFAGLVRRGIYIRQIQSLQSYFASSHICVTILERWSKCYRAELSRISSFLGVDSETTMDDRVQHKRDYSFEASSDEALELLTRFYRPYNEELFALLGYEIEEWC